MKKSKRTPKPVLPINNIEINIKNWHNKCMTNLSLPNLEKRLNLKDPIIKNNECVVDKKENPD